MPKPAINLALINGLLPDDDIELPSLTPEEIQEFKQIVKKVKGIDLNDIEAQDQATRMVKLAKLLMQQQLLEKL